MTKLANYLEKVDLRDTKFVGTIAFGNEEMTLPDGSKVALGLDDGHWVMVYQKTAGAEFKVFEFDTKNKKILVDNKSGGEGEVKLFKQLAGYFFEHANIEDLVTILPPRT